jgi:bacterioferritin
VNKGSREIPNAGVRPVALLQLPIVYELPGAIRAIDNRDRYKIRASRRELWFTSETGADMKGDKKVIELLNEVLKAELTAINQYFLHAEMCENWGYERLAKLIRKESIEEMVHAEKLIERILYLDGTPNMSDYFKINIGATVEQQFKNDVELEYTAVKRLNAGVPICIAAGDNGSRELLTTILQDEEHHIDWLEAQLHAIGEIGIANYLTEQLKEDE